MSDQKIWKLSLLCSQNFILERQILEITNMQRCAFILFFQVNLILHFICEQDILNIID